MNCVESPNPFRQAISEMGRTVCIRSFTAMFSLCWIRYS